MSKKSELSRDWNYEYGIFAKLRGVSGSMWNEEQVKRYMDNQNIPYKEEDKMGIKSRVDKNNIQ